jgi:predicted secreted protein
MQGRTLITLGTIILLLFCFPGCSSSSAEVSLEVTCDEFREQPDITREIEVAEGSTFTVTLCTSATTGFLWPEMAEISKESVLEQKDHAVKSKGVMDTSTKEVWTFQAIESGNSTVTLEYERPWEIEDSQKLWTVNLDVVVK